MSTWRYMNYLGTGFHDAEAIAKKFSELTIEKIRDAVSLLEDMVHRIPLCNHSKDSKLIYNITTTCCILACRGNIID